MKSMIRFAVPFAAALFLTVPAGAVGVCDLPDTFFAGGTGTQDDPWQIATPEHLNNIRLFLGSSNADKYFKLINDIDITDDCSPGGQFYNGGQGWVPIGSTGGSHFAGGFDGDGHSVIGLYINRNSDYQGLFGYAVSSTMENVGVLDSDVTGKNIVGSLVGFSSGTVTGSHSTGTVAGGYRVGGLVGENNPGTVDGCHSYATVIANDGRIGGLVGFNVGGTVVNSFGAGQVTGGWYVGGLVGRNLNGTVSKSYATGTITGNSCVGGLVGDTEGGSITDSYARGSVTCHSWCGGGLVGYLWSTGLTNCFSTGHVSGGSDLGGLVGYRLAATVTSSYWDTETSGQTGSAGGSGRTTGEMTHPHASNTYVGWDFEEVWRQDENYAVNSGYAYLHWQPEEGTSIEGEYALSICAESLSILRISPNPAVSGVSLTYLAPASLPVNLEVYDLSGRLVDARNLGTASGGEQALFWPGRCFHGRQQPAGVYFLRLYTPEHHASGRVLIVR